MKRMLCAVLAAILILSLLPLSALAEEGGVIAKGKCGPYITWTLTEDGTFTLDGGGGLNRLYVDPCPWDPYRDQIRRVVIGDEITLINEPVFCGCVNLTSLTIGANLKSLSWAAFDGCSRLSDIQVSPSNKRYRVLDSVLYYFDTNSTFRLIGAPKTLRGRCVIPGTSGSSVMDCIGTSAFQDCTGITEIVIPKRVGRIGNGAFSGCTSLTEITLPDKLSQLGENAFSGCTGLTEITLPNPVSKLESGTFSGCTALESITIPDTVTTIGSGVFSGCTGLMTVSLPDSLSSIGSESFKGCSALISVQLPQFLNTIDTSAFEGCSGLAALTLPESVTAVKDAAFRGCTALAEMHLPYSLERVGAAAFQGCSALADLYIGPELATVGESAFGACGRLENVYYTGTDEQWSQMTVGADNDALLNAPNLVTEFMVRDRLEKTLSADGVLTIRGTGPMLNYDELDAVGPEYASPWAANDEIRAVVIEPGVTSIGDRAFEYCQNLRSVTIPETVTSIGYSAFLNCPALTELNCSEGLNVIRDAAFAGCRALERVQLPDSLNVVGDGAFGMCEGLREVSFGSGDMALQSHAFWGCSSLKSVTIPDNVVSIGSAVFSNCTNLQSIQTAKDQEHFISVDGVLFTKDMQFLLCCPAGKSGDYTVPDGVAVVGPDAFLGCSRLQYVKLPESCTVVGDGAFGDCTGLKIVALPASVKTYDSGAFYGCTALKDIYFAGTRPEWNEVRFNGDRTAVDHAKVHFGMTAKASNPFRDVAAGEYFFEPVTWAVSHTPQITNGVSATSFAPGNTCTRGQVVTFLWRAKGCPKAANRTNPFRDVSEGDYFYEAVLWANESGVTQGTSSTTFSPNNPCTRAQVVTFLWRSQGSAAPASSNPFRDVPGGEYYTSAVLWAVDQGITAGTGPAAFSPDNSCTRAQIVTFLYRFVTRDTVTVPPPPPEPEPEPEPETPVFTESQGRSYCLTAFNYIRNKYHTAEAIMGTYSYYTDRDGNFAVYVQIDYKIISKYQATFLFVDGRMIPDPVNYYGEQAKHAFGTKKLHIMDLQIDVLKARAGAFPGGAMRGADLNLLVP